MDATALSTLIAAARAFLRDWPERYPDRQAMGILCRYVPAEMVHAAGFTPVRVRGNNAPLRRVDAHLQSFTCALCRSSLDQFLSGDLAFLRGTVFAHTCDAMQALADLWRMHGGDLFVETVMLPAHLDTPPARPYLLAELGRFRAALAAFAGRPLDDATLQASIALYDETRRLIAALQSRRDRLSAAQFFAILDAAQVMPPEECNPLLRTLLTDLQEAPVRARGPRLFLVGAVLDEPRLPDLLDEVGVQVVGDDLCSGSRFFRGRVGAEGDPIARLADYALQQAPCPAKYRPDHDPGAALVDQARRSGAEGVVFVVEKFCEPHAFDYALARPTLEEAGLPSLLLEMEQIPSLEALRTRLQAFAEML